MHWGHSHSGHSHCGHYSPQGLLRFLLPFSCTESRMDQRTCVQPLSKCPSRSTVTQSCVRRCAESGASLRFGVCVVVFRTSNKKSNQTKRGRLCLLECTYLRARPVVSVPLCPSRCARPAVLGGLCLATEKLRRRRVQGL